MSVFGAAPANRQSDRLLSWGDEGIGVLMGGGKE